MLPNPFSPPPPSPRPSPGITPQEKGKLILMVVVLLMGLGVMASMFVFLQGNSGEAAPAEPAGSGDAMDIPKSSAPGTGPVIEFSPAPLFPEEEGAEVERILKEDLAKWKDVVDGVAAVDPGPFEHLLDRVSGNARVMNLQEEGFDAKADPSILLQAPASHRGKLVLVSGELLSLLREPAAIESGLVQEVRRGVLRDGNGRLWSFTWPVGNPLEPDPVEPGDGWVRVRGVFYKSWPVKDPSGGAAEVQTPHLVLQSRPRRDFPRIVVRDLDAAWYDQVHDDTPDQMVVLDEDPLFLLLNLAQHLGPDGWEGWGKAQQEKSPGLALWPPVDLTGRYRELLDNPGAWRFRPIRYVGYLARPSVIKDARPNPGNIESPWIGFLVDQDGAPALWVYSPRSMVDAGFKANDRVLVEGIFVKRVAFVPAGGGPMKRAAVVVAARIVPAPMPESSIGRSVLAAIAAFMLLLFGGLAWSILQTRREAEAADRRRAEKIAKRRAAAGGSPLAAPPAGGGA